MERNENGMPRMGMGRIPETPGTAERDNGTCHNHTCGGDGSCLDDMPLGYVYAPSQKFRMLYSASDALKHGTLFEELYKPKEVYGNE